LQKKDAFFIIGLSTPQLKKRDLFFRLNNLIFILTEHKKNASEKNDKKNGSNQGGYYDTPLGEH